MGGRRLGAYFEAHIEQGPILENTGNTIGVVTGALGQRWFEVTVRGMDAHAGPTPMQLRRDALLAASFLVQEVNRLAKRTEHSRGTVGMIRQPAQFAQRHARRNGVLGRLSRHRCFRPRPHGAGLARRSAEDRGRTGTRNRHAPDDFSSRPATSIRLASPRVRKGAEGLGYRQMDIVSGAGHDAVYIARVAPTAMIFVPCEGGISHNEIENATPEDLAAGCNVLLQAVLAQAG